MQIETVRAAISAYIAEPTPANSDAVVAVQLTYAQTHPIYATYLAQVQHPRQKAVSHGTI